MAEELAPRSPFREVVRDLDVLRDDERAGVLVPPGDDEALAEALVQLVESPDRLREMGEAARARAREFMDADRNALRVLGLLDEIAKR